MRTKATIRSKLRVPSAATVISVLALCVAVGGSTFAVAALSSPEKKQVKKIAKNQVTLLASGLTVAKAAKANDADRLGGSLPADYQRSCEPGAIKGSVKIDTTGMAAGYTTVAGFNCEGGAVQVRRTGVGGYNVRFVGNPGAGTAVATAGFTETSAGVFPGDPITAQVERNADGTIGGELVFNVEIRSADSTGIETDDGGFLDDQEFTLLAY